MTAPATSPDTGGEADGWIVWNGGANPVGDEVVETRHANGDESGGDGSWRASDWLERFWTHEGNDECRIIAYRLATPTPRKAEGWQDISTAPRDGTDILILAGGLAIQARYSPGSWGPDIPGEVREYDGAVWVAFDDLTQFEIEEGVLEGGQDHHGVVTHWMPLPAAPTAEVK